MCSPQHTLPNESLSLNVEEQFSRIIYIGEMINPTHNGLCNLTFCTSNTSLLTELNKLNTVVKNLVCRCLDYCFMRY